MDNISHVRSRSTSPSRSGRRAQPDPNRVFRACELCFKAKTKCDDVTEAGCSRCRARRKDCSLVQAISGSRSDRERSPLYLPRMREYDDAPPAWGRRPSGMVEQHDAQLRLMEDRVRYLEDRLITMQLDLQHLSQSQQHQQSQLQRVVIPAVSQTAHSHLTPSINLFDPAMPADPTPNIDPFSFLPSQPSSSTLDIPSDHATGSASISTPAAGTKQEDFVKVYKRRLDRNCFNKSIEKGPSSLVYDESCFRGVAMDDFPNVIKRGHFTQSQVDLAFHLFKHVFSQIVPMLPFLDVNTPTPTHPFVILAFLTHLHGQLPSEIDLEPLVDESILYAMTGCISPKVVLALYILSFAPAAPSSADHTPVTAMRIIALAYSIGKDLGLDEAIERALGLEWGISDSQMEMVLLWIAVRNRYNLLRLQCARAGALEENWTGRIPDHPSPLVRKTAQYLRAESVMIDAARQVVATLAHEEISLHSRWADIDVVDAAWQDFHGVAQGMLNGTWPGNEFPVLRHELHALTYLVSLRMTMCFANPRPVLSHEHIDRAQVLHGTAFKQTSIAFIKSYLTTHRLNPALLAPRNTETIAITCLSTARRAHNILANLHPGSDIFKLAQLEEAEGIMRRNKGIAGTIIREMWSQLDDPPKVDVAADGEGEGGFNLDWLGIEGFDWLMQATG